MLAGKAVAADSDSDDDDDSRDSMDGDSPHRPRELTASSTPIGGPLSGGLTIPATMNDPGAATTSYGHCDLDRGCSTECTEFASIQYLWCLTRYHKELLLCQVDSCPAILIAVSHVMFMHILLGPL